MMMTEKKLTETRTLYDDGHDDEDDDQTKGRPSQEKRRLEEDKKSCVKSDAGPAEWSVCPISLGATLRPHRNLRRRTHSCLGL